MIQTAARCYEVEAPGRGALRPCELRQPNDGEVLITADYSGISPGTERLVGLGLVPESCAGAMACQGMRGSFALPVTYGYSLVGTTADRRRVFTMHPHQDRIVVASDRLVPIPDDVPSPRAT
ncbi:MAG: dehydrogenase, partial [Planctomycetes bacterium]|nr:dehydrogenase [Planctomycetota bacterium]